MYAKYGIFLTIYKRDTDLKENWSEKWFFDIMDTKWRWVTLHTQFFYFRPRSAAISLEAFYALRKHRSGRADSITDQGWLAVKVIGYAPLLRNTRGSLSLLRATSAKSRREWRAYVPKFA